MTFYVALKEYKKEWMKEKIRKEQEGKKRKRRKGGKEGEGRGMEGRETSRDEYSCLLTGSQV